MQNANEEGCVHQPKILIVFQLFPHFPKSRFPSKLIFFLLQVAGVTATTERPPAPQAPPQGPSTLQLTDEPHMSIAAAENAG